MDSSRYYSFITLLPAGKVEQIKDRLQKLLHSSTSFHQTGKARAELFYSGFMLGLINILATSHIIESEVESGDGRSGIVLIPSNGKGDQIVIIEYKISKTKEDLTSMTRMGLNQIINKHYDLKIKQHLHIKKILKISMTFCRNEMDSQYKIDYIGSVLLSQRLIFIHCNSLNHL